MTVQTEGVLFFLRFSWYFLPNIMCWSSCEHLHMFQSRFKLCRLRLVARVALSLGMSGAPYIIRATQTTPCYTYTCMYVYTQCIHAVYTHSVGVIRGQCVSTHESTPSLLLYKSPTPKHLLIIQIIQNKINVAKKHREVENTRIKKHHGTPNWIFWTWRSSRKN